MIKIVKELKVEVSKPNIFQAIVAKQYDMNTRFLKVTLVDDGNIIEIPKRTDGSIKVIINAERPDGGKNGFEGEVNGDDDTVTVPLHSWMLEIEGTVVCDISIIDTKADDNKKLTTTTFSLLVEKAAYGGDDITNDPQFDVLVALMDAAEVAQEALDKSNEALRLVADCEEATENANAVREEIEAGGYVESLKELNGGGKFSFWVGTSAEYNSIQDKIPNCFYIVTDDPTNNKILQSVDDTGWVNLTINDKFKPYEDNPAYHPKYRKIGNVVSIRGVITPQTDLEMNDKDDIYPIFTGLPTEAQPSLPVLSLCQGSGVNEWLFTVSVSQGLLERYGTNTYPNTIEAGVWLPFNVTYIAQ